MKFEPYTQVISLETVIHSVFKSKTCISYRLMYYGKVKLGAEQVILQLSLKYSSIVTFR